MKLNLKIVAGIIVGIAIIVGILFVLGSSEDRLNEDFDSNDIDVIPDNIEGKQFSLQLSDSVTAIGP